MSYYWNWYKHRYNAFKDAYYYMSRMGPPDPEDRSDEYEEGCCGNQALDDELYGRILLIYLLATIALLALYLLFQGTLVSNNRRRRRQLSTNDLTPEGTYIHEYNFLYDNIHRAE